MTDPFVFTNPLANPIFYPALYRLIYTFLGGFVLILALHRFSFQGLWKSNIGQRYLSWLLIGAVYFSFILVGGDVALVFLLIVLLMAVWEIQKSSDLPRTFIIALSLFVPITIIVTSYVPSLFYSLPLLYFMTFSMLGVRENDAKKSFVHAAISTYVAIWIIFSLSHFILLGHLNNTLDSTKSLLLLLGFAVPLSDIGAYVVGRAFQKTPLDQFKIASQLSPKKSYAGVLGNVLGAALGIGIMYGLISQYLAWYHWVILSVIIGVMGVIGDIVESMFKRYYAVKDSSQLIPGHGGVLDRIDSALRVVIVVYYYLLFAL